MELTPYERGQQIGQVVGLLIALGVIVYFVYIRPRRKRKKDDDNTLDD